MQVISNKKQNILTEIEGDKFFLFCLLISVTHLFFQWYEIFMIIPVYFILQKKHLSHQCRSMAVWLLVFSMAYLLGCMINRSIGSSTLYLIYLFPPLFYMAGYYLGDKYKTNEKVLVSVLFACLFMYAAYYYILIMHSVRTSGELILMDRMVQDESGNATRSATGFALILSVLITGLCFIFSPNQKGVLNLIRILGIALGFSAVYGMATTVTRTSIFEAFVMLLFSLTLAIVNRTKGRSSWAVIFGAVIVFTVGYFLAESSSLGTFMDAYAARDNDSTYSSDTAGNRTWRWLPSLLSILEHPFGTPIGSELFHGARYFFAHNMWLDVGLVAGLIPFVILLSISVKNASQSIKILRSNTYQYFTKLYFFAVFLTFMMSCFVEPVLGAVYNHFLVYIFFCGMVSGMSKRLANTNNIKRY